ncbi:sucrase-isomaltase, intestinal [Eurytemora carolleeae]|uniref:sucrase-isomaltase, intestinal n=1 Tax=Eurytemora carolleeae TaxID=1294199 RepID=UPI000C778A5F|nr:sucrase-isomaltase, intestinal [Eurytemora carolleeae]|eukprot:XP_023324355.1 sucrase-isomaltase, intestinal-like [Eurytemora affinis]
MKGVYALLLLIFPGICLAVEDDRRIDCLPGKDEASCSSMGCIWEQTQSEAPNCYLPQTYGYRARGELYEIEGGLAIDLVRETEISMFGSDYQEITVAFEHQTKDRLRVKIYSKDEQRFEVPLKIEGAEFSEENEYSYEIINEPVFSIKIFRKSSGTVIFDSSLGGLTFSDQFLQISTILPSSNFYGLGEQEQPSFKHDMNWKTWGMFARDHPPDGDINLYGVHPRYTVLEEDGNAHGVLFLNSNAQEVLLMPTPGLVYRTIGGILDIYFFLGPSPEEVVSQYTEAVGRYYVPPYWSLGFQLCRWGYNTLDNMKAAWQRTRDAGIPFDVQWGDIDYMDRSLDFTINPTDFKELPAFVDSLHDIGMKFIPILDPCISMGEPVGSYPPFEEGNALKIWVSNSSGDPLVGKVWPADNCHFPDFSNPTTQEWWISQLAVFHELVSYDGIWIDMNEPANFVAGSVDGCEDNKWNSPPYKPKSVGDTLPDKTICLDAEQNFGRHYDTHSLYGWSQSEPTLRGVEEATGKRGLVLSRSTFVGSGKYAAHWLGDNWSEWDNLHFSIIGILQFSQFGYPLVGADICGFIGNSTEELCARWHQLGAFYPFSRNHNVWDGVDQDPGVWEGGLVARVAKDAFKLKYEILPYLYSLFYYHTLTGATVTRPVWHEFPMDKKTWNIDTQFMLGPGIMVSPILEQGKITRQVYLPKDSIWYSLPLDGSIHSGDIEVESDLNNSAHTTPIHFRGGFIIPTQEGDFMNTVEQRKSNAFSLKAFLNSEGMAFGFLFLDDGESLNSQNVHTRVIFSIEKGSMESRAEVNDYTEANNMFYEKITIYGVKEIVTQVTLNNEFIEADGFNYDKDSVSLTIYLGQECPVPDLFVLHWF